MLNVENRVAVVGVGSTKIARHTERSLGDIALEAALAAIADAGLTLDDVDGYVGAPKAPNPSASHGDGFDEVSSRFMVDALGISPQWSMDLGGMAGGVVVAAAHALLAGACRYVVAVRALYNPVNGRNSESSGEVAAGVEQYTLPYGLGPGGGRFAHWLQRYMHDFGATREELFEIARLGRRNAQKNELAAWYGKGDLSLEDYMAARWISEPMCLFDADMPVTAAAAIVLTTADLASKHEYAAYLAAYANEANARRVFDLAGISPADIDVAQLYDGFSPMVWLWLEKLGLCGVGEAHRRAASGWLRVDGELPLNTFGGALGEGRLHGMGHLREGVLQAMHRCDDRQIPAVRHSLVQIGIPEQSWIFVFDSQPGR
jgi:acetyl-CoA acetyltransferase